MKIFISSLIAGFAPFRDAVRQAVLELNHEPVMAEDFDARPTYLAPRRRIVVKVQPVERPPFGPDGTQQGDVATRQPPSNSVIGSADVEFRMSQG